MEYIDQTFRTIRYYLTLGNSNLSQFTVLRQKTFLHNNLEIEIAIIGESHYIRFKKDLQILTEVCACTDAVIPNHAHLLACNYLSNIYPPCMVTQFDTYSYSFNYAYLNWDEGTKRLAECESGSNTTTLEYIFPSHDKIEEIALTKIFLTLDRSIKIETVHTYPNEDMMVFTKSILKEN